jgi:uncharacterized protein (DUF2249 family)
MMKSIASSVIRPTNVKREIKGMSNAFVILHRNITSNICSGTHRLPVHGNSIHVISMEDQARVIAKYIHWKATSFHGRFNWSYVGEGNEWWYLSLQTCKMDNESIITNTKSRTTTPPALSSSYPLTVPILVDSNVINEQLSQTSVTYTHIPYDFVVYKYLPTQVHLPLNAQSND